jgi:sulfite exporter TauE/SafE
MTTMIAAVFVASLVGSLHCAGMCGGVVALCVGVERPDRGRAWPLHAAYNGGRGLTYAALGAVSGGLGAAIDLGGAAFGLQRFAAIVAGLTMIGIGVLAVLRVRGVALRCLKLPPALKNLFHRGFRLAKSG